MLPKTPQPTPEKRFLHAAALVVSETVSLEQGAYYAGCSVSALVDALHDPEVAQAVEAEVTRLRYSGDLANYKAAKLTDAMLDKLIATPLEDISTGLAVKLTELGLKFREKAVAESKIEPASLKVLILQDGDPDPNPDINYALVMDLRNKLKPVRTIDQGEMNDAQ